MKNAIRKIAKVFLIASVLSGCALNRDLPPWERFEKTHEPLMMVPHPNPNWP